jgi:hypothetical protein
VAAEDVDFDMEEVDEEEKGSWDDNHDPCAVEMTNQEARCEAWKGDVQVACASAVQAAADALCAAVIALIVKACERERNQIAANRSK